MIKWYINVHVASPMDRVPFRPFIELRKKQVLLNEQIQSNFHMSISAAELLGVSPGSRIFKNAIKSLKSV